MKETGNRPVTPPPKDKQGIWKNSPLSLKIILFIAIGFLVFMFFFGGFEASNVFEFIIKGGLFSVLAYLIIFVIERIASYFAKKQFSPKENFMSRLIKIAVTGCPPQNRGKSMYITGSAFMGGANYGRITGMSRLPIYVGKIKKDKDGKIIYKKDLKGNLTDEVEREFVRSDDFDYFFIVKKGIFNPATFYVRANKKFVISLDSDVVLMTGNLVATHSLYFVYPFEQVFEDPQLVMKQNLAEAIALTFDYQGDLISTTTDTALSFNPEWQYARKVAGEGLLSSTE